MADFIAVLLKPVGMLLSFLCSGDCAQQTVVLSFSSVDVEGQLPPSLLPCGGQTNSWLLSSPAHLCTTYAVPHVSQHSLSCVIASLLDASMWPGVWTS